MVDNGSGSKRRPMRTLTVKNFSVLQEAKIEFGKITVLIGPQASGKSLLCKLAYFLMGEIPGIAVESLLDRNSWDDFLRAVGRGFGERFLTTGWLKTNSEATYSSGQYHAAIHSNGDPVSPEIAFSFSDGFKNLYQRIRENPAKQPPTASRSRNELRQDLFVEISLLQNHKQSQSTTYISSGRALFTDASKSIVALQNPDIDPITRRFAGLIAWDSRWKAGYLTTGRKVLQEVEQEMNRIAGGTVAVVDGKPHFLSWDGRNMPLMAQSSGTLELLPMFNLIDQLACFQEHIYARTATAKISPIADVSDHCPLIYLEEPEAHIFPETQYELVKLFARLANDPVFNFDWVITTDSPYILSEFGNLIKAGQIAQKEADRSKLVQAVLPEHFWIRPNDFHVYALKPRASAPVRFKAESILDSDTAQIDGDYLDNVSGKISNELGLLLEIQYGK
jgi:energy-coupling factor transporter ATP-binding protein EcfA2